MKDVRESENDSRCPRCHSPQPHLHPAVQHEGEVQPCAHEFHQRVTPENTPERIEEAQGLLGEPFANGMCLPVTPPVGGIG